MTDTQTLTLAGFLLARIADDELVVEQYRQVVSESDWDQLNPHLVVQIGRFLTIDPARVLAECECKRRIVTDHADVVALHLSKRLDYCNWCMILRYLALPYAEHPDYRQEWRPYTEHPEHREEWRP